MIVINLSTARTPPRNSIFKVVPIITDYYMPFCNLAFITLEIFQSANQSIYVLVCRASYDGYFTCKHKRNSPSCDPWDRKRKNAISITVALGVGISRADKSLQSFGTMFVYEG